MNINHQLREGGQGLVEFAVIFPIFAIILFVLIDGGLLMGRYNNINNGAKEAARLGSVGAGLDQIVQRALDQAHGELGDASDPPGDCDDLGDGGNVVCVQWISGPNGETPGEPGSSVRVTIEHDYEFLTPLPGFLPDGWEGWVVRVCALQRMEQPFLGAPSKVQTEDSC